MKKILLTVVACIAASSIYAQRTTSDTSETSFLKPVKTNLAAELSINPFNGSLNLNNALNQIKVRKFISDNYALRIGFNANKISNNQETGNPYGTNPTINKSERNSTTLGLNLGFERHFKGTKKLSPYIGADLVLADKSSKQETTNGQVVSTLEGAWATSSYTTIYDSNGNPHIVQTQQPSELAYFQYGVKLVSGFDFYISRHFFLGAEINIGFTQTNYKDIKYTQTGTTGNPSQNTNIDQKNQSFNIGTNVYNGIRLGYVL